ncbi:MAG: L,D-transpeptidase [Endomicrobiales bacterium]
MRKRSKKHPAVKKKRSGSSYSDKLLLFAFAATIAFCVTSIVFPCRPTLPRCANSSSCPSDLSLKIDNNALGMFDGRRVFPPKIYLSQAIPAKSVLGASTAPGVKHIYVDLSSQTLYAYQGNTLVYKTFVSTGKWDPTPTGNFYIWEKLLSTTMAGGSGDDAYNLPNVPYVMYFYNDFGLHGAYWHDNFGHPMSHGCVNLRQVDAKVLYDWADGPDGNTPGTEVSICDQITQGTQCVQNNPVQQ